MVLRLRIPTPGTAGPWGTFNYRINSDLEIICYEITITGITAPYQSPANTATHIHQAVACKAGRCVSRYRTQQIRATVLS